MPEYPSAPIPQRLFDDDAAERRWRARFTAPRTSLPEWADDAPDKNVYVSNASGVWEIYAWDRSSGQHRKVTDRPHGTIHGTISRDGEHIVWFADNDGDEFGSWHREPFRPRPGVEPTPLLPGTHPGYPAGLCLGKSVTVVGVATDDGTTIWTSVAGGPAEVIYASEFDSGASALSEDQRFLAISHSEHGDNRHPALRVLSISDGSTVAEKHDGEGKGLEAIAFSPIDGDPRLLVGHERRGRDELLIWDVLADSEIELRVDLPGEITADWYPDGNALLIVHSHNARDTIHRLDLVSGKLSTVDTPAGTIGSARVRDDGTVEYTWSSAAKPPVVRARDVSGADRVLLAALEDPAPESVAAQDAFVTGDGGRIHSLVFRPPGTAGPLPTVFLVHGGPHSVDQDRFSGYRAVWLDAGFAVVQVNYRGSAGYGSAWRDAIEGKPGLTELADIAAVHDWAVHSGLSISDKCVINGASWGGYLALLGLGTQPQRWAAGVASVPVADYLTSYADEMEPLRAFDRALFGGSPEEKPDLYAQCSPITYVDSVRAPVLIVAGENDPRCPIRQIHRYVDRLVGRGALCETYFYDAGHGSFVVAETMKQTAIEVDFTRRMLAN